MVEKKSLVYTERVVFVVRYDKLKDSVCYEIKTNEVCKELGPVNKRVVLL